MEYSEIEKRLEVEGVRLTPNRKLVLRALNASDTPKSLTELETELETVDKSSISRVLTLLMGHGVLHSVEDGRGIVRYELCREEHHNGPGDMHAHFYCEECGRLYCFHTAPVPMIDMPEGFVVGSVNYMLKGKCARCSGSKLKR